MELKFGLLKVANPEFVDTNKILDAVGKSITYVSGPDRQDNICVTYNDTGNLYIKHISALRYAPIYILDGYPVYEGDTLYLKRHKLDMDPRVTVSEVSQWGDYLITKNGDSVPVSNLTVEKPKVQRNGWINIYTFTAESKHVCDSEIYATEELAIAGIGKDYITVTTTDIHWVE